MKIIIVGCGQVGETLAAELGNEGNSITMVDLSSEKISDISSRLDIMGVVGNGATYTTLKSAGIGSADLLIAVTNSDELNLLCCIIARRHSRCQVIARIQNPEYSTEAVYLKSELGLAMVINPDYAAAEEIARILRFPAANNIETFAKGRVELLKFRIPDDSPLIGTSVKNLMTSIKCDVLICTAERGEEAHIVNGDFVFQARDLISITASPRNAAKFFKKIGMDDQAVNDVFMVGINDTTRYLCGILRKSGISIKVLDSNKEKCEEFATEYDYVTVICGDEKDQNILIEEGIERTEAFVSLTDSDEENVFLSISAKNFGSGKIITKINKPEYNSIIRHLDFDTTIFPKSIASDKIVRYVRAMTNTLGSNVENMYTLANGEIEVTEFLIGPGSPVIGIPLSKLGPVLKDDSLVAAILRGKSVIIPHGQDSIISGDAVIIASKHLGLNDISDLLR